MTNAAYVRPKLARWDYIRTIHETLQDAMLELELIQLPYRKKDSWLAVEFPATDELTQKPFNIAHDTLSIVAHGPGVFVPASKQSGLLVDDWVEFIPSQETLTGITFNYNQPNACPPQTLLLAVTPEERGRWSWEALVGILNDTLQRAKRRAVEPQVLDGLNKPELAVLLPALVADFSQYDLNISLDYRLNMQFFRDTVPIVVAGGKPMDKK